ncbi:MAG: hypothetical protein J1E06_11520 [Acutalibacter sp.]|nr:hypothetical protein [Acutalibacter sp.]
MKTSFQTPGFAAFVAVGDGGNFASQNRPQFPKKGGLSLKRKQGKKHDL